MFRVTHQPIDLNELVHYVADPEAGAIVPFIGTTRNNNEGRKVIALDYEAYLEMAEKELARIGAAFAASRFAIEEIKKAVPIWKKEVFEGGEVWIGTQSGQPLSALK